MAKLTTGHQNRRSLFAAAAAVSLLLAAICCFVFFSPPPSEEEGDVLTIYTSSSDELLNATIPLFEKKYKIQVVLVKGETVDLLEQIQNGSDRKSVV